MPELRKASQHFTSDKVQFGTVDCTLHSSLCSSEGIRSYPTTALYNGSKIDYFHGKPNEEGIVEFVEDMLSPSGLIYFSSSLLVYSNLYFISIVIHLDENTFGQLKRKPSNELWVVDFFAPWCGPCQRLAPQWRALGKQMAQFQQVKIAQVDCEANHEICNSQNVRSYPTIRLYPLESKGLNTVA